MIKAFPLILLLFCIGCSSDDNQPAAPLDVVATDNPKTIDDSFDIKLNLTKADSDLYNLTASIALTNGSYVISPFSDEDTYGHFTITIDDSSNLMKNATLLEMPNSVEEFDSILNTPVKFVRENTSYTQQLKVVTKNDFETTGTIWFVLEPSCVPYEIEFLITSRNGEMTITKTKTSNVLPKQ